MKEQKGITLIALVITIIVLLILAGVSIAMLTGENGILTKATTAKDESTKAEVLEAVKLGLAELQADVMDPTMTTKPEISPKSIATKAISNNTSIEEPKSPSTNSNSTDPVVAGTASEIYLVLNKKEYKVTYTPAKKTTTGSGDTETTTIEAAKLQIDEVTK